MSMIAAAYSSYTTWSISQSGTAAADADTGSATASTLSAATSSVSSASVTTVTISYRAKLLLARASSDEPAIEWYKADHAMRSAKARAARAAFLQRELKLG